MTVGVIATLKVNEGKGPDLEAIFRDLAPQVLANEAGAIAYKLTKSRTEPGTYKVLELYKDEDALAAHGQSEHFKAAGPRFSGVLAGRPDIERLDGVD
ncbi:MAG: putative quinol monooxygenase [Phenylobacterium sp.]